MSTATKSIESRKRLSQHDEILTKQKRDAAWTRCERLREDVENLTARTLPKLEKEIATLKAFAAKGGNSLQKAIADAYPKDVAVALSIEYGHSTLMPCARTLLSQIAASADAKLEATLGEKTRQRQQAQKTLTALERGLAEAETEFTQLQAKLAAASAID